MKKYNFVYLTTNLINGKKYLGKHSTNNFDDGYLGSGKLLNKAITKYGRENFKREILEFCKTSSEAYSLEEELGLKLCIVASNEFYNLNNGGKGNDAIGSYIWDNKRREEFSKAVTGRVLPKSVRDKIGRSLKGREVWNKGKTGIYSEETIKSISDSLKSYFDGNGIPKEVSEKISKSLKGRVSPMKGRKHKGSTIELMKISNTESRTKEVRDKISNTMKSKSSLICPHCGKVGKGNVMFRYHFDNCKVK